MDRDTIIRKVARVYEDIGYEISNPPHRDYTTIRMAGNKNDLNAGEGIHQTDIDQFLEISNKFSIKSIFVIGNAFGYSTFILAEIFRDAFIDVIDAEIEGSDNRLGSDLTRAIAKKYYPNVRLTIGFSPDDIKKAMNSEAISYDFVFIDGKHTNDQVQRDFAGILPYLSEKCVFYFHDIGYFNLFKGFDNIKKRAWEKGFDLFCPCLRSAFSGSGIAVRNVASLKEYIKDQYRGYYFRKLYWALRGLKRAIF